MLMNANTCFLLIHMNIRNFLNSYDIDVNIDPEMFLEKKRVLHLSKGTSSSGLTHSQQFTDKSKEDKRNFQIFLLCFCISCFSLC